VQHCYSVTASSRALFSSLGIVLIAKGFRSDGILANDWTKTRFSKVDPDSDTEGK
jgi:hypothetical protein